MMLINSYNLGGAEKLVYDICLELKNKEYADIYICSIKSIETKVEKQLVGNLEQQGIKCLSIDKGYKSNRINAIKKIRKILIEKNINILHTHGQSPDFYGRLASVGLNVKTIVTIHSTFGYSKNIEKIFQNFTDIYTAVSKETRIYMEKNLNIKKPIVLIENGIDVRRYENINSGKKQFKILTVGRVDDNKGYIELFLKIAPFLKKYSDVSWHILGNYSINDEYYCNFVKLIKDKNLEDRIIFKGTVLFPEDEYITSSCFLLNSKFEGFGIAYIEAMASTLPIIGNKVGVIHDIYNYGGKIELISEIDICNKLEEIYKGTWGNEKFLSINKKIVENYYSISSCTNKYFELYRQGGKVCK